MLILGHFPPDRQKDLDALREVLRKRDYSPIYLHFNEPGSQRAVEIVLTLAYIAHFIIADFTEPKLVVNEVEHILSRFLIPVQPISLAALEEPPELSELKRNYKTLAQYLLFY